MTEKNVVPEITSKTATKAPESRSERYDLRSVLKRGIEGSWKLTAG